VKYIFPFSVDDTEKRKMEPQGGVVEVMVVEVSS
jgi:hypothetical protein